MTYICKKRYKKSKELKKNIKEERDHDFMMMLNIDLVIFMLNIDLVIFNFESILQFILIIRVNTNLVDIHGIVSMNSLFLYN